MNKVVTQYSEDIEAPLTKEECLKWMKALRSGTYQHGCGELHSKNEIGDDQDYYCCLGVLRELLPEQIGHCGNNQELLNYLEKDGKYFQACKLSDTLQDILSSMNDSGSSFEEIADYIEKYVLPECM